MARLPVPGGDDNAWGAVLNEFLAVAHAADGSLKADTVGASQLDGTTTSILDSVAGLYEKPAGGIPAAHIDLEDVAPAMAFASRYGRLAANNTWSGTNNFTSTPTVNGQQITGIQGPPGLIWRGTWSGGISYGVDDVVMHSGRAFIAIGTSTGVTPPTTATSNATWGLLTDRGEPGPAGPGAAGQITPADMGLLAWTFDPLLHSASNPQINAGELRGTLMRLPSGLLTALRYHVWVAGAGLTTAQVALIDATTGNRIAVATTQATNMQSTGHKRAVFDAPVSYGGGLVYGVLLAVGTTMPRIAAGPAGDTAMVNARGPASTIVRAGRISGATGQTSIAASYDLSGNSAQNTSYWMAVD